MCQISAQKIKKWPRYLRDIRTYGHSDIRTPVNSRVPSPLPRGTNEPPRIHIWLRLLGNWYWPGYFQVKHYLGPSMAVLASNRGICMEKAILLIKDERRPNLKNCSERYYSRYRGTYVSNFSPKC